MLKGEPEDLQRAFASASIERRLERTLKILKKELGNARLGNSISKEIDDKISKKNQGEFNVFDYRILSDGEIECDQEGTRHG